MELATVSSALAPLALLACPVGMGVMMWMMGRGMKSSDRPASRAAQPPSLEVLREEQERLNAEIERLEERSRGGADSGVSPS